MINPQQEIERKVSVKRRKRGSLRRHWLTGALLCVALGLTIYTGTQIHAANQNRLRMEAVKQDLEAQVASARRENEYLRDQLTRMTDDANMELLARQLGFVHPSETVYQKGSTRGR